MEPAKWKKRFVLWVPYVILLATPFSLLLIASPLMGYSVLGHEALIDAAWKSYFVPALLRRYPNATAAQLREAHAYAYGGCVIQDMGYYPLGNTFFSKLTHYVRSGDFVEALLDDSRNIDEYAFALGALSHYVADNTGHPLAVNPSVSMMYSRLRQKYGNRVTYEEDPTAHIMTEFSFDVVQITGAGYLPRTYHNFIGFRVPKPLLNRAFRDTYGLKLGNRFRFEGMSLWLYKLTASEIIPDLSQILWQQEKKKLFRVNPQIVTARFAYRLSPQNYERPSRRSGKFHHLEPWTWHWKAAAKHANVRLFSRLLVLVVEIMPKVGPLRTLEFKPPTVPVQDLFIEAFDVTVARYESDLTKLSEHNLDLPNENLDTGKPVQAGQYFLADQTYAKLLHDLAKHHFRGITSELRHNILSFYANPDALIITKEHPRKWRRTLREIAALKSTQVQTQMASH